MLSMAQGQAASPGTRSSIERMQPRRSERIIGLKRSLLDTHAGSTVEKHYETKSKLRRPLTNEASICTKPSSKAIDASPNSRVPISKTRKPRNAKIKASDPDQKVEVVQDQLSTYDPVGYWARNETWPPDFQEHGFKMSEQVSNKRRKTSSHRSDVEQSLALHNIFMEDSRDLKETSKEFSHGLLKGNRQIIRTSVFNLEQFGKVLDRVALRNEARIQRDVTSWVVPSAEILDLLGDLELPWVREEVNQDWHRCITLGSTRPKPDYTAGLGRSAFSSEETQKLENWASSDNTFFVTANLCFPFLICELKNGESGLDKAERQATHAGGIAVNSIIQLHKDAFGETHPGVRSLSGQVLVYSIAHSNNHVRIYGHFAVFESGSFKTYQHLINSYDLKLRSTENWLGPYNFVVNVYEKFAKVHWQRIIDAVARMAIPAPQLTSADTGLSKDGDGTFKKPDAPSSISRQNMEIARLREEFAEREIQYREEFAEREIQYREDAVNREAQQTKLIEQLREDNAKAREDAAKREAQQTKLIEQLREDAAKAREDAAKAWEDTAKRDTRLQSILEQLAGKM